MKKYNLINNSLGWLTFVIATVTYMMTLEPTASFWDCGEFIAQGYKLEVGHPPGNPIFMLAANFFTHFASSPSQVAICVNAMSALLSAGTILLLFWTITHLVRRLLIKDDTTEYSWQQIALIMGSGLCGALAYAWSDTFWFSAVEAEVYAFSSFCTALTFWLILKWENRADNPSSDRYLVAIAYVIGVSVAVHLLNLLCIPAIILVIYYKKFKNTTAKGSLLALLLSFAIIALILFGLVPGFVEMAQYAEIVAVNTFGFGFNSGAITYTVIFVGVLVWTLYEFHKQTNLDRMKLSFLIMAFLSGMFFMGSNLLIPVLLTAALAVYLFAFAGSKFPIRIFQNIALFVAVIFAGYSSYALILLRSNAQTPMDQNSPDNVFELGSYLNREQYGKTPLLYGPVYSAPIMRDDMNGAITGEAKKYVKQKKTSPDEPDRYIEIDDEFNRDYKYAPNMNVFFPRLYDAGAKDKYERAMGGIAKETVNAEISESGRTQTVEKPKYSENIRYFFEYQLNYMYWRYFLWNFAGRQNDIQGHGEITHGNWISGIPFIDNARLGDQSLLPDELGKDNKGHNVFYMLPLLLGLIGLLWQAYSGKRGIEQFWTVFFLFFMTGIAIVVYLNQVPEQPRERDYAYAGSFYAFAIWIGMGVAGLYKLLSLAFRKTLQKSKDKEEDEEKEEVPTGKASSTLALIAVAFGIFVPLQMVSQTWDDHDRSGRYACRDFGMNYLSSVEKNGIIFSSGDNDTFPLWYAQEVEGWRTDVRVVNESYLSTDWYIAQMSRPAYESEKLPMQATEETFAYNRRMWGIAYLYHQRPTPPTPATKAIADYYSPAINAQGGDEAKYPLFRYPNMFIPLDREQIVRDGLVPASHKSFVPDRLNVNLTEDKYFTGKDQEALSISKTMTIDIVSKDIEDGWKRPVYFAMSMPDEYYSYFGNYMQTSGMAYQVTPIDNRGYATVGAGFTDKAFSNISEKFRWGGLDTATPENAPYCDETVSRMVNTTRTGILETVANLVAEAEMAQEILDSDSLKAVYTELAVTPEFVADRYRKAKTLLLLSEEKLPEFVVPASFDLRDRTARYCYEVGKALGDKAMTQKGDEHINRAIDCYAQYVRFCQKLDHNDWQRIGYIEDYIFFKGGFLSLLVSYYESNPEGAKKKIEELEKSGVKVWDNLYYAAIQTNAGNRDAVRNTFFGFQMLHDLMPERAMQFLEQNEDCATAIAKLMGLMTGE